MSSHFIDSKKNSKQLISEKIGTLSYYIGMLSFCGLLLYSAFFIKTSLADGVIISQILINWAISILIFLVLIEIYRLHYSYKNHLLLNPKEWINTVENSYELKPAKFKINQGRKFIIDKNSFSFLSEIQEGKYIGLIILIGVLSLVAGTYPYFVNYGFDMLKNYMYFFFGCIAILIIIIFLQAYFFSRYNNLNWKLSKTQSDIIECSITNSKNKIFNEAIHKNTFETMQIVEKSILELHPDSKFFKNLKAKTKVFILTLTLPPYVLESKNELNTTGVEFSLSIHSSREFVELIKEVLTTWLTIENGL